MKEEIAKFSIIVTSYNSAEFLDDCLRSIVCQNYDQRNFEVICVDDGSTDPSPKIVQNYARKHGNIVFLRTENRGLEKTCNYGIKMSQHPWVMRVDADDFINEDLLLRMSQAIQRRPEFDFYYCKNYFEYYSVDQKYPKELPDFDPEEIFQRGDFFATGTVYRKSSLSEVGFFPEEKKNCGLENYAVILSLLARGKQGLAVPGACFSYRRHRTNMSILKKQAIIEYGRKLLAHYGRPFVTNRYHPYGLELDPEGVV